ncbi:LysM peptidoglycan-binding domain-containing protein [Cohnella nanjingensis]|uniref:LysM peptidoglycan-binding domain-containing protein n=1 Tax=Cohnella nanjingensis TaxID=1387779 RepID=A0A7X0RKH9_9BACL|nr:LysM peptidoglycan-binding domain-containing protein [Cohnella nanjingensis]MBB6669162.1 LysM peptidoglycan-binding domain-containing protein [Cohnella nanjingensis]
MVQAWVLGSNSTVVSGAESNGFTYKKTEKVKGRARAAAFGFRSARSFFFLAAFLLLFSGFAVVRSFAGASAPEPAAATEAVVSVDAGDTLWSIAESVKRDGLDTREAVHRIMKRNGLTSSSLDSGQELIIPVSITPRLPS